MRTHIKDTKNFFKGLFFFLIIAPLVIHVGFIEMKAWMREISISELCLEPLQWSANDFMSKYGDKHFAFDLIRQISERDPYLCEPANHEETFSELLKKYPDMREEYLGALVEGILDSRTKYFNRVKLIGVLEKNTGIDFDGRGDGAVGGYEKLKPYTQKGIQNVADWWTNRLRKNAAASIAATEKDYKFPLPPSQRGR